MWPTPTPIPIGTPVVNLPFDPQQVVIDFTGNIVQGWNFFNSSDIATIFFIGLLIMIIFFGLMSIRSHMEKL